MQEVNRRFCLLIRNLKYNEKKGTIVSRCEDHVTGFTVFKQKFYQKVILAGRSQETFKNYLRAIAQISLFYKQIPLELTDDQINHYLTLHKTGQLDRLKPSEAYFKHAVFGMRYMFKMFGINDRQISMPVMKRKKPLRDILNRYEVMQLLKAPRLDKHRIAFALAYGSGLRIAELIGIKTRDIDVVRKTVHVRDGKGGYDRLVPLSDDFIRGYLAYIAKHKIDHFVFPGQLKNTHISIGGMQHALINARRKAGIIKKISMHNMRHSYAVHFLEDTGDLLQLKKNLGHRDIKNTMNYLKYVQHMPQAGGYSPLTKVFVLARSNQKN